VRVSGPGWTDTLLDSGSVRFEPSLNCKRTHQHPPTQPTNQPTTNSKPTRRDRLQVKPEDMAIMMAEPTHNTRAAREKAVTALFESQSCAALFLAKAAVLSAFAVGKQTALVVDAGYRGTTGEWLCSGGVLGVCAVVVTKVSSRCFYSADARQMKSRAPKRVSGQYNNSAGVRRGGARDGRMYSGRSKVRISSICTGRVRLPRPPHRPLAGREPPQHSNAYRHSGLQAQIIQI
jgi:hypothetical protein